MAFDYRGRVAIGRARPKSRGAKKTPIVRIGVASLIAVITVRHLLREEKQGTTALQLSFAGDRSRGITRCDSA